MIKIYTPDEFLAIKKGKIVRFNREFHDKELYQQIRYTINKYWDMSFKFNIENADGTKIKVGN